MPSICLHSKRAQGKQGAEECDKLQVEMLGGKEGKRKEVQLFVVASTHFISIQQAISCLKMIFGAFELT